MCASNKFLPMCTLLFIFRCYAAEQRTRNRYKATLPCMCVQIILYVHAALMFLNMNFFYSKYRQIILIFFYEVLKACFRVDQHFPNWRPLCTGKPFSGANGVYHSARDPPHCASDHPQTAHCPAVSS